MVEKKLAKVEAAKNIWKNLARTQPDPKFWADFLENILKDDFVRALPHRNELLDFLEEVVGELPEPEALKARILEQLPRAKEPEPIPTPELSYPPGFKPLEEKTEESNDETIVSTLTKE